MALSEKIKVVDHEEGLRILDRAAMRYLGISGVEFLRRWDNLEYAGKADTTEIMRVAQLIQFAR